MAQPQMPPQSDLVIRFNVADRAIRSRLVDWAINNDLPTQLAVAAMAACQHDIARRVAGLDRTVTDGQVYGLTTLLTGWQAEFTLTDLELLAIVAAELESTIWRLIRDDRRRAIKENR